MKMQNNLHEQAGKTIVKAIFIALIVIAIAGYSYFQARNLIKGPQVSITSPSNGTTLGNPMVTVSGTAKNISFITLNNRQIFVDDNGNFKEDVLLSPGYNTWELQAKDKFGRVVTKNIELIFRKS